MKQRLFLLMFVGVAIVQLLVPGTMIYSRETTLQHGQQVRFRTAPVDPYDPFRGRYVALQIESSTAPLPADWKLVRGQRVYVQLETDPEGFATLGQLSQEPPNSTLYLQAPIRSINNNTVRLRLPFDRYYLEESLAPEAERAYRRHSQSTARDAYITVRLRKGQAVLEELFIAGQPILTFLAQNPTETR